MHDISYTNLSQPTVLPSKAAEYAVRTWFAIAAAGHWIFLIYILAVLYPPLASQGLQGLEGLHLPSGFREGDTAGNIVAASHVLLAAIVIGGGPLQLLPALRRTYPTFHRYLGRTYLSAAVISALGGLHIVWTRGTVGNALSHVAISGDALLILIFAAMAIRHAVARRIEIHQRWALRLFMAASAVWFFRVGLMGWFALTGGIGIDSATFTGPYLSFLGFAQYLLPLAMLEWHFRCKRLAGGVEQALFAGTLLALTAFMALGIFAATMGMWLPRL